MSEFLVTVFRDTKACSISIEHFNTVFKPAWQEAVTPERIRKGFALTGVLPFSRKVYHDQRRKESDTLGIYQSLTGEDIASLQAQISSEARAYTGYLEEVGASPSAGVPGRRRGRPEEEDGDTSSESDSDDGDSDEIAGAARPRMAAAGGGRRPSSRNKRVRLEDLCFYGGGITGDEAMGVIRDRHAETAEKERRSAAAALLRQEKRQKDAAEAERLLADTPIVVSKWKVADMRLVLKYLGQTAPQQAHREDMAIVLTRILVEQGRSVSGAAT